jgi:hypothetical protein
MIQIWIQSGRIASQQKVQLHLENVRTLCNEDDSNVLDAAVTMHHGSTSDFFATMAQL